MTNKNPMICFMTMFVFIKWTNIQINCELHFAPLATDMLWLFAAGMETSRIFYTFALQNLIRL